MKRSLFFATIICVLFSCKKVEVLSYDVQKDNIYLNYQLADSGNVVYSFAYHPALEQDTVWIPVIVSGMPVHHDRHFAFTVVDSTTTAVQGLHFEPLQAAYTLPADSGTTKVPVILLNKDTSLETKSVFLTIKINGGQDFDSRLPDTIRTKTIFFSSRLEQPEWWAGWGEMGPYSRVKHQLFLISSGTTDLVVKGSYPDWYLEIPRSLYYIANTRAFLNHPFEWVRDNPSSGYILEKRTDGTEDYDFYNPSLPNKKFYLKYFPAADKYVFIDENGQQVTL